MPESSHQETYSRGVERFTAGDYQHALEDFSEVTKTHPEDERGWEMLATTLAILGRYQEALDGFVKVEQLGHECTNCWFNRAITYKKLYQTEDAIKALTRAVDLDPKNVRAWVERGSLLGDEATQWKGRFHAGYAEMAVGSYDKALEIQPDLLEARIHSGYLIYRLFKFAKSPQSEGWKRLRSPEEYYRHASKRFDYLSRIAPENSTVMFYKGLLALEAETPRVEEAEEMFSKLLASDPRDAEYLYAIARVHRAKGEKQQALELLKRALRRNGELHESAAVDFGEWYEEVINPPNPERDSRIKALSEAAAANPQDVAAWEQLAWTLAHSPRAQEALEAFGHLEQLGHGCPECLSKKCDALIALHRDEESERVVQQSLELYPENTRVLLDAALYYGEFRGEVWVMRGRQRALEYLKKAVGLDPNFYRGWLYLTCVLYQVWQSEISIERSKDITGPEAPSAKIRAEAIEAAARAMALRSDDKRLWELRAYLAERGEPEDLEEAKRAYMRVVELAPDYANGWWFLAQVLAKTSDHAQFLDTLRKAVSMDDDILEAAQWQFEKSADPEVRRILALD